MTSPDWLQYIDVYMDDLICADQGDDAQKQRVLELMLCFLKEILPSIPGDIKDSTTLKKDLAGGGELSITKDILGWLVET